MKKLIIIALVFFGFASTNAQSFYVNLNDLNNTIPVGKEILINSKVSIESGDKFSILDTSYYKKKNPNIELKIIQDTSNKKQIKFLINSYDTGYIVLGPFGVIINQKDTLFSEPILRYFSYPKITPENGFKKSLNNIDFSLTKTEKIALFFITYWWVFLLLVVIPIIVLIVMFYIRKNKKEIETTPLPTISLKDEFLEKLKKVNEKSLWQNGKVKEYHTEVTFTIRLYITKRYKINALELTSTQIASSLKVELFQEDLKQKMTFLLSLADMVKFAKEKPSSEENERILMIAEEFINQTHKTESN